MAKYKIGQELITKQPVAIHVYEMNGKEIDEIVSYPKGEVFEIVDVLLGNEYRLSFWLDSDQKVNGEPIVYTVDCDTVEAWLRDDEEI